MSDSGAARGPGGARPPDRGDRAGGVLAGAGYGRYVAVAAIALLVGFILHNAFGSSKGSASIESGMRIPPFAAPLALGGPVGEVDVATRANQGRAGKVPACSERGPGILNICQMYQRGPVVLALYFDAGSCARVLDDLQRISPSYPRVGFAAVAIREGAASVARLVRSKHLTLPVGVDTDGRLGGLYRMIGCPEIMFVYPGGVLQSAPLLQRPPLASLRLRVNQLLAASKARGWRAR